jgi:hypothetical protein
MADFVQKWQKEAEKSFIAIYRGYSLLYAFFQCFLIIEASKYDDPD